VQTTHIAQALMLLVSGVYYDVSVLPAWVQPLSAITPSTYILRAMRAALMDGASVRDLLPTLGLLLAMGVVLLPLGLRVFTWGEEWARRSGLLSRNG
jgi:ABC-2 type transport system permease protein